MKRKIQPTHPRAAPPKPAKPKDGRRTGERSRGTGEVNVPRGNGARPAGIVTGWRAGRGSDGELSRAIMARIASDAGLPADVLPPARSGHAHAARALRFLEAGYAITRTGAGVTTTWKLRDKVTGADVATVRLTPGDEIRVDADDRALRVRILGEWARLRDEEAYAPGDVTDWIRDVLRSLGGVRLALNNWYVPARSAERALRFTAAIQRAGWGEWQPPLSQSLDDSLRAALSTGLVAEVLDVSRLLGYALQEAASRGSRPGAAATQRFLDDLREIAVRALGYHRELGVPLDDVRTASDTVIDRIAAVMTAPSAAVLWADAAAIASVR